MEAIDRETGQGEVDLFHVRIEQILCNTTGNTGLTKTQYKCWKKAEGIDARVYARGRRKSERIKERAEKQENTTDRTGQSMMPGNAEQRKKGAHKKEREDMQMETWRKDQQEEKDF